MSELILKVETKVIKANANEWKIEQLAFLAGLPQELKTDDDFSKAKAELAEITAREKSAKIALDMFINENPDVKDLIETVTPVIEELRQARLARKKLIDTENARNKTEIVNAKIEELKTIYNNGSPITEAFAIRMPLSTQIDRINNATKNRRTIESIKASVNTEFANISAESFLEVNKLNERLAMLPSDKMHLFNDAQRLIASEDDLQPIIDERIEAETVRLAEIERKAQEKARIEAGQKAIREAGEKPLIEANEAVIEKTAEAVEQEKVKTPIMRAGLCDSGTFDEIKDEAKVSNEPTEKFQLTIMGKHSEVVAIAKQIKEQFESVSLKRI